MQYILLVLFSLLFSPNLIAEISIENTQQFGHLTPEEVQSNNFEAAEAKNSNVKNNDHGYNSNTQGPEIIPKSLDDYLQQLEAADVEEIEDHIDNLDYTYKSIGAVISTIDNDKLRESAFQVLKDLKSKLDFIYKDVMPNKSSVDKEIKSSLSENYNDFTRERENLLKILEEYGRAYGNGRSSEQDKLELDRDALVLFIDRIQKVFNSPLKISTEEQRYRLLKNELEERLSKIKQAISRLPKAQDVPQRTPVCFISYAWGHSAHERWVHDFDRHLQAVGLNVHIDIRNIKFGSSSDFMDNVKTDDYVLVIGTREYREKSERSGTGVFAEVKRLEERIKEKDPRTIIKVLLDGDWSDAESGGFPSVIDPDIFGSDFRCSAKYSSEFFDVIRKLYESRSGVDLIIEKAKRRFEKIEKDIRNLSDKEIEERYHARSSRGVDLQEQSDLVANYFEREEATNELTKKLEECGVVAITGIAGAGKSQLAHHYAHKVFKEEHFHPLIATIRCDSKESLDESYRRLAVRLKLAKPGADISDFKDIQELVRKKLGSKKYKNKPFILIFDGADVLTMGDIEGYFPKEIYDRELQQIIITSQSESFHRIEKQNIYIGGFTSKEAERFLLKDPGISENDAQRLAKEFSNLPLGLQCASLYIKENKKTIYQYLELLRDSSEAVEIYENGVMERQGYYKEKEVAYRNQRAAISLSIKKLSKSAQYFLKCCSFFNNDRISRIILDHLLVLGAEELGFPPASASAVTNNILFELKKYCLLVSREQEDSYMLSMHQVVQRAAASLATADDEKKISDRLVRYYIEEKYKKDREVVVFVYRMIASYIQNPENVLIKVIDSLIKDGWKIRQKNEDGSRILHDASCYDHEEVIEFLLKKGANINEANKYGWTALMLAAKRGHIKTVRMLLKHKAKIDKTNIQGKAALTVAAYNGRIEVVKELLKKGAKIDKRDSYGQRALIVAAKNGHTEVVKLLLDKKSKIDRENKDGMTALMFAAQNGHTEVVNILLGKRAKIDSMDNKGMTALMFAAQNGHIEVVRELLEKGADVYKVDNKGMTPLMCAEERGYPEVANILRKKAAEDG